MRTITQREVTMRLLRPFVLAIASVALAASTALAAPPDPFRGAWNSTDIVDGSSQKLTFGGGGDTRRITLNDRDATIACGGGPVIGRAVGEITGDSITGTLHLRCANGNPPAGQDIEVTWTYNAGTDTLTDTLGDTWFRP